MQKNTTKSEKAPVVVVMGHIDHGKSSLLSYIRKNTELLDESGGITQHISAYEVEHTSKDGKKHQITFLDTPGHEAFRGIRSRGANVADVAILVVSAEDGVKPQTLEALASIKQAKIPYIVAINKIDKPDANIERTKQNLAENEIYIEGYGGDIPAVAVSAKSGEGISELLDMIILVSELESLTGEVNVNADGVVIESNLDTKKGISATCIIKNGTLEKGMFVASGVASSPVRIMENYLGKSIDRATFSSPIKIIGWDNLPQVGCTFKSFKTQKEVRSYVEEQKENASKSKTLSLANTESESLNSIPIIVKVDTGSSLEAVLSEIKKLETEKITAKVISSGIGTISENDVRLANGKEKAIIIGFNTKIDSPAKNLAERNEVEIKTFEIIYKMSEWLKEALIVRTPKVKVEEMVGNAKILKIFSKVKDKQIVGGKVEKGLITLGSDVKIIRRSVEIGTGRIRGLQIQKTPVSEVKEGKEFGSLVEAKMEIAPGDYIESYIIIEK
ncbi:MAG: translation initiation factor IF-2 [Minisyncoccia bacterium]